MKKIVSLVLALALLCGMCLTLASCAKVISGTYKNDTTGVSYEFKGNKFEKKTPLGSSSIVSEGTYEINETEDGTYTITFDYSDGENEDDEEDGVAVPFAEINDGKQIKIGILTYTKQ